MKSDIDTLERFFASAPFMVDLGVQPYASSEGRVATKVVLAPRHFQHTGVVHAGVIGALADHTMGAAAQTTLREGQWVLTAEFKVNLLRAARGQRIECEARVVKPGRLVAFTEAQLFAVDGDARTLVATASATMAVTSAA